MKILMINVVCGIRSTGRICTDLATSLKAQGHEVIIAYGRETVPEKFQSIGKKIGNNFDVKIHGLKARLTDGCGWGSKKVTKEFVRWIEYYNPDVIHLHNLHGYYINLEILFSYLRICEKKIIWTLHDCWAFTGHAAFCEAASCEKWIKGCNHCPKLKEYPVSITDHSRKNWKKKKELMKHIPNMTIVTPSEWLAKLVRKSFLSEYPVQVVHNGVDTNVFKKVDSRRWHDLMNVGNKKVLLGVASTWDARKGLEDFFVLREKIDNEYIIILVGLSQKQINRLPDGIIGISRTDSVQELAELYNLADIFINPTYEDNYPTTNLEAIACGTPVLTYYTGGSPESALLYGYAVEKGNVDKLKEHMVLIEAGQLSKADFCSEVSVKHMVSQYIDIIIER